MALPLVERVQEQLETDRFGHSMRGFESVASTNTLAADWARDGASEGNVVVTEYQSEGRGRHGRIWTAKKGQNLMFSVVLRPTLDADKLGLITVASSVAVAEALDAFVQPHRTALKWPNDVLLEGRKTCGMLLESSLTAPAREGRAETVVLGVGLNVNQTSFPDSLADTATSLHLTTGRAIPRPPLFARLLGRLEKRYDAVEAGRGKSVRSAFHDRLISLGESKTLRIPDSNKTISGVVRGITDTGALRLDTDDGPHTVHAGDVTSNV